MRKQESEIFATLSKNRPELLEAWPGAEVKSIPGTRHRKVVFSDGSTAYITEGGKILSHDEANAKFFYDYLSKTAFGWLMTTPQKDWPLPLRDVMRDAAAKDAFGVRLWEEQHFRSSPAGGGES